ncbi:Queuosine synthesis-like protein [Thermocrinis albus DSM 14484]|uniref:7-cyano-7-deazaguanine synthase n=1 Tax=Thermocrinis albus (strain DSM 14484 / JCM 11386 / HI 11/12) TaxID=638303 RepID=D3SL76_THEAH|nr:7-cyano-7-deazaguanine synthase [Thermocrinis albus]ADC89506.1 Queuosine synthesis-like protein [Thermocrinis albus DSM 14484]
MKKVVVLFSGGVESSTLLYLKLKEGVCVYPVYVREGMSWEHAELFWAKKVWHHFKESYTNLMPLCVCRGNGVPPRKGELFIPLRNLRLAASVATYALRRKAYEINIGSLGAYPFPDNNLPYLKEVEKLLSVGSGQDIKLEAPLFGMDKRRIVELYGPHVPLHLTFSCIKPIRKGNKFFHCGKCVKCLEREEALSRL